MRAISIVPTATEGIKIRVEDENGKLYETEVKQEDASEFWAVVYKLLEKCATTQVD